MFEGMDLPNIPPEATASGAAVSSFSFHFKGGEDESLPGFGALIPLLPRLFPLNP